MKTSDIFSRDYAEQPYWWDAWDPRKEPADTIPPARTAVLIVGGGYAGLCAALALREHGADVVVAERDQLGMGASSRNGGGVSGGVNLGKTLSGRRIEYAPGEKERILSEAAQAYGFVEDLIPRAGIACHWQHHGRFVGAWTPKHLKKQEASIPALNTYAQSGSFMVDRADVRGEIDSDIYYGGQVIARSSTLHPALYYKGLLDRCREAGVHLCARTEITTIEGGKGAWTARTAAGATISAQDLLIATNGYTGPVTPQFRRRLVPIASNIIVTEPLPAGLAESILPKKRMINDSLRIRSYYRLTPDDTRLLYGGRGKFAHGTARENAQALYALMAQRLPQLAGIKVDYAWSGNVAFTFDGTPHFGQLDGLHYVLGCNGSGVAMMSYLGHLAGMKIAGKLSQPSVFESALPAKALYSGNPWFLPMVGGCFKILDRVDRALAERT